LSVKFIAVEVSAVVPPAPYIPPAGVAGIGYGVGRCTGGCDRRRRNHGNEQVRGHIGGGLVRSVKVHHRVLVKGASVDR
jgi:hypothetical protein